MFVLRTARERIRAEGDGRLYHLVRIRMRCVEGRLLRGGWTDQRLWCARRRDGCGSVTLEAYRTGRVPRREPKAHRRTEKSDTGREKERVRKREREPTVNRWHRCSIQPPGA